MRLLQGVKSLASFRHFSKMRTLGAMHALVPHLKPVSDPERSRCSSSTSGQKGIKAVIFDMGGVILPSPLNLFNEFEVQAGLPKGTISQVVVGGGMQGPWSQLELGNLTLGQFTHVFSESISRQVGRNVNVSPLVARISQVQDNSDPAMIEAIKCIRGDGFKTALLTNNWFTDEFKVQTYQPLDKSLFDVIVESCVVGFRKPQREIYSRCLEELRISPDQAIFLDDLGENLKAAKALGITTIKVTSTEQGLADLQRLLDIPLNGFVPGTTSVPKHLLLNSERLEQYLKSLGLQDNSPPRIRVFEHGQSNPTYFVSYGGRDMVLRKKPPGKLLPSAHAVDREFRVMSALQKAGVPAPNMVSFCEDESVIGTQFYLMDYLKGRVFKDIRLLELQPSIRREVVLAMVKVLALIHSVDVDKAGLADYGRKGNFVERNFKRWASQYQMSKTHEIPAMDKLMDWLPRHRPQEERVTVVHGDFRLDNLMYHSDRPEVIAVLDWELSTLGDPLTDLATCVMAYYLPLTCPMMVGLAEQDIRSLGVPSVEEIKAEYCRLTNLPQIENWDFYLAFVFFRAAAILQGVYKRNISGQGSSSSGIAVGEFAESMANIGWEIASKSGLNPTTPLPDRASPLNSASSPTAKGGSTSTRQYSTVASKHHRAVMSTLARPSPLNESLESCVGQMAVTVEGLSPQVQGLYWKVKDFIQEHVAPLEELHRRRLKEGSNRWTILPELEVAKSKAKAAGLWNLFLPLESDPEVKYGVGLTNLEYAFLCEEMGKYMHAPEVFNCSAPDTGNMEILVRYGTEEQKQQWLLPLLEGRMRSCFAMTEPQVASSDARNIQSAIVREGDHYVINGHKWWTSGALDPRCKLCIFMGKTNPEASVHRQQSMILVPMDAPGIKKVRPLTVFGYDHAPEGHAEVMFENVKVPAANILLGEGRGFEIAQGRLGPGRIHHCMRLIGGAERALALLLERTIKRIAFGKPLAAQGSIREDVARSRVEIEQCRLLVLKAAYMMDLYGNKVAAPEIAMIKVAAPSMALSTIDRAIQAHGGAGVHDDLPLGLLFSNARMLRIADGPDEVHLATLARTEYARRNQAKL